MNDDEKKALQRKLKSLQVKRENLSLELKAIHSELTSSPGDGVEPIGIDTPLVDKEGYPRGDVDLYRARDLRKRWNEIQNDQTHIMKELEINLVQLATIDRDVSQLELSCPNSTALLFKSYQLMSIRPTMTKLK